MCRLQESGGVRTAFPFVSDAGRIDDVTARSVAEVTSSGRSESDARMGDTEGLSDEDESTDLSGPDPQSGVWPSSSPTQKIVGGRLGDGAVREGDDLVARAVASSVRVLRLRKCIPEAFRP